MQDMRKQILNAVIDAVAVSGVDGAEVEQIVDRLDIPRSRITMLFGSVEELQAEALIEIYQDYIDNIWMQTRNAGPDPEARFRARAMSQLIYCLDKPGWSVILDYPSLNPQFTSMLCEKYGERLNQMFELNMGRLAQTILDVQNGTAELTEVEYDNVPRGAMLANEKLVMISAAMAWGLLGMTIWSSGRHTPSVASKELDDVLERNIQNHINNLIDQIKRAA